MIRLDQPISPATLLIAAGIALRLAAFLANREYWLDEAALIGNLTQGSPTQLTEPLQGTQLVPPLFLAAERFLIAVFGTSRFVTRSLPLLAGIASLFLFHDLTRRILNPNAALLALALLAFSDEQIYYATELKPYMLDVAIVLALSLGALHALRSPPNPRQALAGICLGCLAIWSSFPALFALAAACLAGSIDALRRRHPRHLAAWCLAGSIWLLAALAMRSVALAQLGGHPGMWRFWDFAFPPSPLVDPGWIPRRLFFMFLSPLDWYGPFDPRLSALPAIACALIGLIHRSRSSLIETLLLIGPLTLALLAASLRLYPFHGRCLLFAVPALLLLVADGAETLARHAGPATQTARLTLTILLLAFPLFLDLNALLQPRQRADLHPHGDRRPPRIAADYHSPPPPSPPVH